MTEIPVAAVVLVACFALVVVQEAVHGFHDCANAVAPVVATRALAPRFAIPLAAMCNFLGEHALVASRGDDGIDRTLHVEHVAAEAHLHGARELHDRGPFVEEGHHVGALLENARIRRHLENVAVALADVADRRHRAPQRRDLGGIGMAIEAVLLGREPDEDQHHQRDALLPVAGAVHEAHRRGSGDERGADVPWWNPRLPAGGLSRNGGDFA